jgi:tetratricopeptide (TPR) repeat protein
LLALAWFLPARLPLPRLRRARPYPAFATLLLALFLGACGGGDADESLRLKNDDANALFAAGDYQGALDIYQELLAERPDVDELSYNAGNALHRLQSYERAIAATSRGLPPREVELGVATYYALGNHFLQLGRLEEAYVAYRQALLLEPNDADSKHNLELVLLLATSQQQPGEQQPPGQSPPEGSQPGEPGDDATPAPGGEQDPSGEPQPGASPQGGTPEPGASGGSQVPGTPQATPPSAPSIDRTLAEALAGLDEEVSFEEAIEILDLLRQKQQTPQRSPGGASSGFDY